MAEAVVRFRELGIVLALLIVIGGTALDNQRFLSATSLQQLLSDASIVALLAIGQTLVIVTRNVDLSVGSILGLTAYMTGDIFVHYPHASLVARARSPERASGSSAAPSTAPSSRSAACPASSSRSARCT